MEEYRRIGEKDVEDAFGRILDSLPPTSSGGLFASENRQKSQVFDANLKANSGGFSEGGGATPSPGEDRSKTSLRMQYEAEAQVIRKKLGGLEEVRKELGLSRRKMCQLLMVDPSAWTRWTQDESKVPPHVYRALQWYLALIEKQPEWHPMNTYLGAFRGAQGSTTEVAAEFQGQLARLKAQEAEAKTYLEDRLSQLRLESQELKGHLQEKDQIGVGWKLLLLINFFLCLYLILF